MAYFLFMLGGALFFGTQVSYVATRKETSEQNDALGVAFLTLFGTAVLVFATVLAANGR